MQRYLLDTNALSDLMRRPAGSVASRIAAEGEASICTSIIVASELRFGAAKRSSEALSARVAAVLEAIEVLPFDEPADRRYAELRDHLERAGTPIGPNDMLIAAHALARDLTVVTRNLGEFSRVAGLRVEDWSAPAA
jgi:tRNA(fMet)-specific endonuclease VapC